MPNLSPIAAQLRAARHRARLSQVELAARAGVSQQMVSLIEHGRCEPGVDTADSLARALGIRIVLGKQIAR
jgi:transcriptional regulator with XRE-family HTH domain